MKGWLARDACSPKALMARSPGRSTAATSVSVDRRLGVADLDEVLLLLSAGGTGRACRRDEGDARALEGAGPAVGTGAGPGRERREFREALLDADSFEDLGAVAGRDPQGGAEPAGSARGKERLARSRGCSRSVKATRHGGPSGGRLALRRGGRIAARALVVPRRGAGAAFDVPTLVDLTTITPPGSVNTGRTIRSH